MGLTEAEDIKKRWQEYTELYKKDHHFLDNHNSVITTLESDTTKATWQRHFFALVTEEGFLISP